MKKNKLISILFQIFTLAVLVISVNFISGCNDSVINSPGTTAPFRQSMVERQFALSSTLKAEAGAVIVVDLEDLNSPSSTEDTGPIGEDIIPYTYTETRQHRFEIADSSNFKIKMVSDATGTMLFELNSASSIVVTIPEGNYKLHLISLENHSPSDSLSDVIFIQPNTETAFMGSGAGNYSDDDLNTLLQTRRCFKCHLDNANLANMDLREVKIAISSMQNINFSKADLRNSVFGLNGIQGNFDSTKLDNANMPFNAFSSCSMNGTSIKNVNFHRSLLWVTFENIIQNSAAATNFSGCDISLTKFKQCRISNAVFDSCTSGTTHFANFTAINSEFVKSNFSNCDISGAFFNGCKLYSMNFANANLNYATFKNIYFEGVSFCGANLSNVTPDNTWGTAECWPFIN